MRWFRQMARREVLPRVPGLEAVLLVGSHAEGNATPLSDVDLVAVVRDPRGRRYRARELAFETQGRAVSVSCFSQAQLRRRLDRLDRIYVRGEHLAEGIATRLGHAVVLYDRRGVGQGLISRARRYQPSPRTYRSMLSVAIDFYEDVLGSLAARDPETAMVVARQAAAVAIDCYLLMRGERSLKPKWHLRRLRRLSARKVLDRYRAVLGVEKVGKRRAVRVLSELEALICEVFGVPTLQDLQRSPLWALERGLSRARLRSAR